MIRKQTFFASLAVLLSCGAAVASASTDVPSSSDAQYLTIQEPTHLRLDVHELAAQHIELQRQMKRQLQDRERVKSLTAWGESGPDSPSRLQVMANNQIRTQTQERANVQPSTHAQVREQTRTRIQRMDEGTSSSDSSGRSGSGKR